MEKTKKFMIREIQKKKKPERKKHSAYVEWLGWGDLH